MANLSNSGIGDTATVQSALNSAEWTTGNPTMPKPARKRLSAYARTNLQDIAVAALAMLDALEAGDTETAADERAQLVRLQSKLAQAVR